LPSILKGNSALEIGEDDVEELGKKEKQDWTDFTFYPA